MNRRDRSRELPVFPVSAEGAAAGVGLAPAPVSGAQAAARPGQPPKIGVVTLGCDKNTVDSERLMAALAARGARISREIEGADLVVINTCGFIQAAKEESIETILEACAMKKEGRVGTVAAVGCMVERHGRELAREIPEVDIFLGLSQMRDLIPGLTERGLLPGGGVSIPTMELPLRVLSSDTPHSAHLKISEGCDHTCAFCSIPDMRGLHRSAPVDELVREARELERKGVRELSIVSQDTTWYGRDLRRNAVRAAGPGGRPHWTPLLPDLLRALLEGTAIPWIRLFYMYPSGITPEIVALLEGEQRILPYLDMPVQHGADTMLRRMRRPERQATIRERVARLRAAVPGLVLRTTVIVGFPGETEEEFRELIGLIGEIRFERLGAFTYSREEGTPAAAMPGQVPDDLKRERLERLMDVQRTISFEANEALVGQRATLLVDRCTGGEGGEWALEGRTCAQAAEVDGLTRVSARAPAVPGSFLEVEIVDALDYDLIARPAGPGAG
ncbi:MAG: 30S ribosomal protein S12 methylthiotransferase RimO [Gammaproteobacteria bacterium]|nr:30S ribosomal protein S12 methylthiotransferase RimO [Gammaproteobacteria bacterium]